MGATRTFQFQTGSIKSKGSCQRRLAVRMFQFQTGSIKSGVRVNPVCDNVCEFQFQTGSIKR